MRTKSNTAHLFQLRHFTLHVDPHDSELPMLLPDLTLQLKVSCYMELKLIGSLFTSIIYA